MKTKPSFGPPAKRRRRKSQSDSCESADEKSGLSDFSDSDGNNSQRELSKNSQIQQQPGLPSDSSQSESETSCSQADSSVSQRNTSSISSQTDSSESKSDTGEHERSISHFSDSSECDTTDDSKSAECDSEEAGQRREQGSEENKEVAGRLVSTVAELGSPHSHHSTSEPEASNESDPQMDSGSSPVLLRRSVSFKNEPTLGWSKKQLFLNCSLCTLEQLRHAFK